MNHSSPLPTPGLLWGSYPERRAAPKAWGQRCTALLREAGRPLQAALEWHGQAAWLAQVRDASESVLTAAPLEAACAAVRARLVKEGLTPATMAQALGLVCAAAHTSLKLQPFDTQLLAARAVLENRLCEMATGEGKTLAVALAAAVGALAGMPVHVITANEYLVARDAKQLQPLYAALGLSVGCVVQADAPAARQQAYACHVTYVTASELVFDYLRDGLSAHCGATHQPQRARRDALAAPLARLQAQAAAAAPALLRGLCMAIVDEADAVLIDDARVPLILSQPSDDAQAHDHAQAALSYAQTLHQPREFVLNRETLQAALTDKGRLRLQREAESLAKASGSAAWRHTLHREHAVCTALAALHLYQPERHYLVREGKVGLIDQSTGRVAQGRVWSNGLQQLIELKENCIPSPSMATVAQITYQRFFPRYVRLGGLSGTVRETRAELMQTYGTAVQRIALRRPCLRQVGRTQLFANHAQLWVAVAERIAQVHATGRPVLVATDSVADVHTLSHRLTLHGLTHTVLHARNDADEADVVAQAGQLSAITITTNMSGRGTDIELGEGVNALGGLHVICCQLNSARRMDRQLAGRAARQGNPGSVQTMLSLENPLLSQALPAGLRRLLQGCAQQLPSWAVRALCLGPQWLEEASQREQRRRLIEHDERTERQLGFGGGGE
jgi:preprotein translocase subunit SecA